VFHAAHARRGNSVRVDGCLSAPITRWLAQERITHDGERLRTGRGGLRPVPPIEKARLLPPSPLRPSNDLAGQRTRKISTGDPRPPSTAREKVTSQSERCDGCGLPLGVYSGCGRPRKRCSACAADKSALGRRWRAENPERVAAFNEARRVVPTHVFRQGGYVRTRHCGGLAAVFRPRGQRRSPNRR
jgi:hypothetical protein